MRRSDGLQLAFDDVAERLRGGTVRGSWFEQLVETCVASPTIPPIERQFSVYSTKGAFVARPDLAIPSLRLAIEAHSRKHHTGPTNEAFDEQRDNLLAVEGWDTAYDGWSAPNSSPLTVRGVIEQIVARRASDLGVDLAPLCRR